MFKAAKSLLGFTPNDSRFFDQNWQPNLLPSEDAVLELFFDPATQAYCVMPLKHLSVFLSSGQPLGTQRQYHLRRRTILSLDSSGANGGKLL